MNTPELQKVVQHFDQFGAGYSSAVIGAVTEPTSAAAVPEPSAASILIACAMGIAGRHSRLREATCYLPASTANFPT